MTDPLKCPHCGEMLALCAEGEKAEVTLALCPACGYDERDEMDYEDEKEAQRE